MSDKIISKRCSKCKKIKPISEFNKDSHSRDGFRSECRTCQSKYNKKYYQTERGKAIKKCYIQSEQGKAIRKRYLQSEKRRSAKKRYQQSEKGKATQKRYTQSKKGKARQKHYQQNEKFKIQQRHYRQSETVKVRQKHYQKRYRQTEKGRKAQIDGQKRYKIRHPERAKARIAVIKAVKTGRLPRPDSLQCHYCPAQANQYHHHNGYEPIHYLDVIPVCTKCHNKIPKNLVKSIPSLTA